LQEIFSIKILAQGLIIESAGYKEVKDTVNVVIVNAWLAVGMGIKPCYGTTKNLGIVNFASVDLLVALLQN